MNTEGVILSCRQGHGRHQGMTEWLCPDCPALDCRQQSMALAIALILALDWTLRRTGQQYCCSLYCTMHTTFPTCQCDTYRVPPLQDLGVCNARVGHVRVHARATVPAWSRTRAAANRLVVAQVRVPKRQVVCAALQPDNGMYVRG